MTEEKMEEKAIEEDLEGVDVESPEPEEDTGAELDTGEEESIEALTAELAAAKRAGKEYEDRFMRIYAEFENYKKRAARETQEFRKFANEALIKEVLPVIDNLERAIQSSSPNENDRENVTNSIIEGVTMTLNEMLRVLDRFHVKPIESLEQPFDPSFHEAVGQEESDDFADNTVIREYQKGYLLHDRLIRPAMVVVSRAKPAPAEVEPDESDEPDDDAPNCEA